MVEDEALGGTQGIKALMARGMNSLVVLRQEHLMSRT